MAKDMLSSEIKQAIINEYITYIRNIEKDVDLFEMVIDYPSDDQEIAGVTKAFNYALNKFFSSGNESYDSNEEFDSIARGFYNVEPFLKKLIHMVDKTYPWEVDDGIYGTKPITLMKVMKDLRLIPNRYSSAEIENEATKSSGEMRYICASYQLRNSTAHEFRAWNRLEKFVNLQNVMITYLVACDKHKDQIVKVTNIEEQKTILNADGYIRGIIKAYEKSVHDGFKFVPLKWRLEDSETTMISIWQDIYPANHVLLMGEAGCGKTTSVEYLAYCDAKKWMKDNNCPVPVIIRLIDISDTWFNIEDVICSTLNIPLDYCRKFLRKGLISVYLDGLNEMISSNEIKANAAQQIEKFVKSYSETKVVITDRIHEAIRIDFNCTQCFLKKMTPVEAREFVVKTTVDCDETLLSAVEEYVDRLESISFTPILLLFIRDYYYKNHSLPETSDHLIYEFFKHLMEREVKEKKDINASSGRLDALIMYLACQEMPAKGWSGIQIKRYFKICSDLLGIIDINTEASLNLAVQLGILSENNGFYRFADEKYQDCFMAYADINGVFDW